MSSEIERFIKWLRCRSPHAATHVHYASDLKLFFAWAGKPANAISFHDVDAYIAHCRDLGHTGATVNRRLAALRCFYRFLRLQSNSAPTNPVRPRHSSIHRNSPPRESSHVAVSRRS